MFWDRSRHLGRHSRRRGFLSGTELRSEKMTTAIDHYDPPAGFPKGLFLFREGKYWETRFIHYCRITGDGETNPWKILERDKLVKDPLEHIIGNTGRYPYSQWIAGKWKKWCASKGIPYSFEIPGVMGAHYEEFDAWLAKEAD